MDLFFVEWTGKALEKTARELARRGFRAQYWTADGSRGRREMVACEFPEAVFHDTFDAIRALPAAGIDAQALPPPPGEVVRALQPFREEALWMMRRVDYTNAPEETKERFFNAYIQYWYGVLATKKPDAVVFSVMPHMVYDFVLYHLARALGIPTIMYETARVGDRVIAFETIEGGCRAIQQELAALGGNISPAELAPDLRQYWNNQREATSAEPFYMQGVAGSQMHRFLPVPSFGKIATSALSGTLASKARQYVANVFSAESRLTALEGAITGVALKWNIWKWDRMVASYRREYEKLQRPFDPEAPYVYMPLHYQPEKNTSPQGGRFVDQRLMVRMLSDALPPGWTLLVKEHASQWRRFTTHAHQGRWKGYYKELAHMPNVALVPVATPSHQLIRRARAVATVSGTAGWEAVLRGVPAMVFGYPWYGDCSSILKIRDAESCRSALGKIVSGFRPDERQVLNFLYCLNRVAARGYVESKYQKITTVSPEANAQNMADLLVRALSVAR